MKSLIFAASVLMVLGPVSAFAAQPTPQSGALAQQQVRPESETPAYQNPPYPGPPEGWALAQQRTRPLNEPPAYRRFPVPQGGVLAQQQTRPAAYQNRPYPEPRTGCR